MKKEHKSSKNQHNFINLFLSLIFLLFGVSYVNIDTSAWSEEILDVLMIVVILVAVKSLKIDNTWRWTVYALVTIFLLMTAVGKFIDANLHVYLILATLLIFFIGAFLIAAKEVLFVGEIDLNSVIGSLSLYLLLGLIWAVIYLILLVAEPSSFSGIEIQSWQQVFPRVIYYSFVTLTTLGYGDILPTTRIAEFFVYMEAVIGVFYMAIIVSSLVSINLSTPKQK